MVLQGIFWSRSISTQRHWRAWLAAILSKYECKRRPNWGDGPFVPMLFLTSAISMDRPATISSVRSVRRRRSCVLNTLFHFLVVNAMLTVRRQLVSLNANPTTMSCFPTQEKRFIRRRG